MWMAYLPTKLLMLAVRERRVAGVLFTQHELHESTEAVRVVFGGLEFLVIRNILLTLTE